jgi:predicted nucleic acid-binding protein
VLDDENDSYADSVLSSLRSATVLVPAHWLMEITNALLMAERRNRTTEADTTRALALLRLLPIEVDFQASDLLSLQVLSLARSHGLTVYDAAYLEVSIREGLPLATLDAKLATALVSAGGKVA